MDGTQTQVNPNGNRVVKNTDGSSITYMVSGEEVHEESDGRRRQLNPDGSLVVTKLNGAILEMPAPEQILQSLSTLQLLQDDFDGRQMQHTPEGKRTTVCLDT